MSDVYSHSELESIGCRHIGRNVAIHRSAVLFNPQRMEFADDVRVDCFAMLSAGEDGMRIGRNVHIAAGCYLFGGGGAIDLEDFSGLSSRVSIYTATDDYVDGYLTNPTVPDEYRKVRRGAVILRKHVIIGAGSVILPGVELGFGASVGALTCIRKNVDELQIWASGAQKLRNVGERNRERLETLEGEFRRAATDEPE